MEECMTWFRNVRNMCKSINMSAVNRSKYVGDKKMFYLTYHICKFSDDNFLELFKKRISLLSPGFFCINVFECPDFVSLDKLCHIVRRIK